ncbi:hypothetical protein HAX54_032566 [Datura stramonium]|uniref:Uncharacterized protein n=1 Tax=Datura stramonium TaxID=4076 RepID=A0ABS8VAW9_DATST|nr:hypothetical protein [Datura stramonium]
MCLTVASYKEFPLTFSLKQNPYEVIVSISVVSMEAPTLKGAHTIRCCIPVLVDGGTSSLHELQTAALYLSKA